MTHYKGDPTMKNEPPEIDLIVETHIELQRQGPGSQEMTIRALQFLDNRNAITRVVDLGCGTGGQTMVLAEYTGGSIVGVDLLPDFIDILNSNARNRNLRDRVRGIVGSMDNLDFPREEFDLVWSEGAIDSIGFEQGFTYWNTFLKTGGYIAVTCPSWLDDERPTEVEKLWINAGSKLDSIEDNIAIMQKSGYGFIAAFTLPDSCWTDNYFTPRQQAEEALLRKYAGIRSVETFVENSRYEVELFTRFKQHYGYVFYIGQKLRGIDC
jgi:SAM-dependent methyltransferase